MSSRALFKLTAILLSVLLASCAQHHILDPEKPLVLNANERYVLVSFVEDGDLPPGLFGTGSWRPHLFFRKVGTDQVLTVPKHSWTDQLHISSDLREAHGYVYVLALEPGEYEFHKWSRIEATPYATTTYESERPFSHRFTVMPKGVSYLGEIRMTAVTENVFGIKAFGGFSIAYSDHLERDIEIAKAKYPRLDFSFIQKSVVNDEH